MGLAREPGSGWMNFLCCCALGDGEPWPSHSSAVRHQHRVAGVSAQAPQGRNPGVGRAASHLRLRERAPPRFTRLMAEFRSLVL